MRRSSAWLAVAFGSIGPAAVGAWRVEAEPPRAPQQDSNQATSPKSKEQT